MKSLFAFITLFFFSNLSNATLPLYKSVTKTNKSISQSTASINIESKIFEHQHQIKNDESFQEIKTLQSELDKKDKSSEIILAKITKTSMIPSLVKHPI